eukprot:2755792-Pyramimonas_sp.AAC.2
MAGGARAQGTRIWGAAMRGEAIGVGYFNARTRALAEETPQLASSVRVLIDFSTTGHTSVPRAQVVSGSPIGPL